MRKLILIYAISIFGFGVNAQTVFINELNYTATNTADRGIGVAGPQSTSLTNWEIQIYDNTGAYQSSSDVPLSGSIPNEASSGYGEIWYPVATLTTPVDDINLALVDDNGTVQQFISFGSSAVTASGGAANGLTSDIINVAQSDPAKAVQLTGTGTVYVNFLWDNIQNSSPGSINPTQVFSSLPVELKKFEVELDNNKILLNWETGSEENNKEFIIERSPNHKDFSPIGTVEGSGTTTEEQFYEFIDETPDVGWNYYRLKQVDFDGRFEYSEIVSIYNDANSSVAVYPNPIVKGQSLHIQSSADELDFTLATIDGKALKTQKITGDTDIDCSDLPPGIYIYQLTNGKDWMKSERLVIVE